MPLSRLPFIDIPLVQAPMSGATSPQIVAAVSDAGGLGSLPVGYVEPDQIAASIAAVRALTGRPFAVNLFVATHGPASGEAIARANERLRPYRELLGIPQPPAAAKHIDFAAQCEAVIAARPAVFRFTFGIPSPAVLAAARAAGIFTIVPPQTLAAALALDAAVFAASFVQGYEAGGHPGPFLEPTQDSNLGTLALCAMTVSAVKLPVLAAGGIGDGRGIAAVLALGATAAQVGTAFILCDESAIAPAYRRALKAAGNQHTTLTRVFSGRTARGIRNRFIDEMTGNGELAAYPYQHWLTRDIRNAAAAQDLPEFLSLFTGQAVSLARELPARRIVELLMEEARTAAAQALAATGAA